MLTLHVAGRQPTPDQAQTVHHSDPEQQQFLAGATFNPALAKDLKPVNLAAEEGGNAWVCFV